MSIFGRIRATDEEITIEEKFWQAHFVVCQNAPAKEDGRKIMLEAAVMMATKLIAEARASILKEARKELIRLSNKNRDYDWVVREFDGWIAANLRERK